MTYVYNNKGTCSVRTEVELNPDHTIAAVRVLGGCNGNLKGIAALCEGMKADEIASRLKGLRCGFKSTSCPDRFAAALEDAMKGTEDK